MEILALIVYKEKQNLPKETPLMAKETEDSQVLDMSDLSLNEIVAGLFFFLGVHLFFEEEFYKFFIESPYTESWRQRFPNSKRLQHESLRSLLSFYRIWHQVLVSGDLVYCANLEMNAWRKKLLEERGILPEYGRFFSDLAGKFKEFTMAERSRTR